MELKVTPSGTHCWLCGRGPFAAGHPVCPCAICAENYKKTREYQPPPEVWKPNETPKTDAS